MSDAPNQTPASDADAAARQRRLELARKAFREFYAQCFWSYRPDAEITEDDIPSPSRFTFHDHASRITFPSRPSLFVPQLRLRVSVFPLPPDCELGIPLLALASTNERYVAGRDVHQMDAEFLKRGHDGFYRSPTAAKLLPLLRLPSRPNFL
jgi:hypothetical protein